MQSLPSIYMHGPPLIESMESFFFLLKYVLVLGAPVITMHTSDDTPLRGLKGSPFLP